MKRASDVPPPVESAGRRPVTSSTAPATRSVNAPCQVQEGDRIGRIEGERMTPRGRGRDASGDLLFQRFGRPQRVEADVEQEPDLGGDDVRSRIADVDGNDFEVRRVEVRVAVDGGGEQGRKNRRERPDRIVGDMRVGDMALPAEQRQPPGQRTASSMLDRVAERFALVGSPTTQWSKRSPLSSAQRISLTVPLIDGPSSSPVTRKLIEPGKAPRPTKRRAAAAAAASPPSCRRRRDPSCPSATSAANGPNRQRAASPGGTTSVCPAKTKFAPARRIGHRG